MDVNGNLWVQDFRILGFPDYQGICGFPKNFLKICIFFGFPVRVCGISEVKRNSGKTCFLG